MRTEHFEIAADESHTIHGTRWIPDGTTKSAIQLFHGLGEHHVRYERFARVATERGFAVVAHDHRGHGPNCEELGFFADTDGWQKLLDDGRAVRRQIDQHFPDRPRVLLGHSMGSYIAQAYVMQHPDDQDILVLSASTWTNGASLTAGHFLARLEERRSGARSRSALLNKLGFGNFNRPFEPARTPLDWLSRDEHEVDLYIADPLCDGPYTCSLWKDLTAGLRGISSHSALERIPKNMPMYLTGGSNDPVGGQRGITKLAKQYQATEHSDVTVRIYPDGRHEMFNETNREEFTNDLLDWLEEKLPAVART